MRKRLTVSIGAAVVLAALPLAYAALCGDAVLPQRLRVTLPAQRCALSQALAELTKQTGIPVSHGDADPTIQVDVRDKDFWPALDAVADAAKMRVNIYPSSGRIVVDKRGPNDCLPPISYAERFRLCVKKVTATRDLERRDGNAPSGSTNLTVEIAWDPLLLPLYLETRPRRLRLVDDKNKVLTIPDDGSALAPVDGLIAQNIDVRLPRLPRSVNAIRSLQGELSMIGPSKMLAFTFGRLDRLAKADANAPERSLRQENVVCRIRDVKLLRERWSVRVALDYPPGMKQLDSNQSWVVNNEMELESPDGKKRLRPVEYVVEATTPRQAVLWYHFRDTAAGTRGKPSAWRIRYRAPAKLIEMPIPFAFKDIELP